MYGAVIAERNGERIQLTSNYSDKDLISQIPGRKWRKESGKWDVPLTWASCRQLRSVFGERLEIGPGLHEWATEEVKSRIEPCTALRNAQSVPDSENLPSGLYPFQKAGAQFLVAAGQAILADEMGAGKTCQTIAALVEADAFPAIIVCPNSVKRSWQREFETWAPQITTVVVQGTAKKRTDQLAKVRLGEVQVCIINWEGLRAHSALAGFGAIALTDEEKRIKELNLIPFKAVVADEAHRLADCKSKQTRALWRIAHGPTVERRYALTGTPLTNKLDTLYPILHFLNKDEWPSRTAFIDRYCQTTYNHWGGLEIFGLKEETKEEFFAIFDPRFRRMPKAVVLPHLPPIQRLRRYVTMSPKQAKGYRTMAESMIAQTDNGGLVIAQNPVSQMTRLVQYSSASIEMEEGRPRLTDPSCKLDQLMADLPDFLDAGESVVVFAVSRQLIEMAERRLDKAGIGYRSIKGGQSVDERQNSIDMFQAGGVPIICVVLASGGVGITLTRARVAIFLQLPWSNVDYEQACGRVHRIGSEIHESVMLITYLTEESIEEWQLDSLEGKAARLEEVVRDKETIKRLLRGDSA